MYFILSYRHYLANYEKFIVTRFKKSSVIFHTQTPNVYPTVGPVKEYCKTCRVSRGKKYFIASTTVLQVQELSIVYPIVGAAEILHSSDPTGR